MPPLHALRPYSSSWESCLPAEGWGCRAGRAGRGRQCRDKPTCCSMMCSHTSVRGCLLWLPTGGRESPAAPLLLLASRETLKEKTEKDSHKRQKFMR